MSDNELRDIPPECVPGVLPLELSKVPTDSLELLPMLSSPLCPVMGVKAYNFVLHIRVDPPIQDALHTMLKQLSKLMDNTERLLLEEKNFILAAIKVMPSQITEEYYNGNLTTNIFCSANIQVMIYTKSVKVALTLPFSYTDFLDNQCHTIHGSLSFYSTEHGGEDITTKMVQEICNHILDDYCPSILKGKKGIGLCFFPLVNQPSLSL